MTGGSKRNQTAKLLKIHQHSLPGQFLDACASWGDKLLFYFKLGYRILLHRIRSYLRLRSARGNQTYTAVFYHDRNSSIILENTNSSIGQHPLGMELWRGGFFGKGSLSRGEPTWYARMRAPLKERRAESLALQKRLLALLSLKNEIAQDSGASGDEDWQPESQDVEQYVLTPEETFFLAYAIGSLDVRYSEDTDVRLF